MNIANKGKIFSNKIKCKIDCQISFNIRLDEDLVKKINTIDNNWLLSKMKEINKRNIIIKK
jgi:hypothetical protein